ncbi:hypothetical protein D9M73_237940 [compost metagenome]
MACHPFDVGSISAESIDDDFRDLTGVLVGHLDGQCTGVVDDVDQESVGLQAAGIAVLDIGQQLRQQA